MSTNKEVLTANYQGGVPEKKPATVDDTWHPRAFYDFGRPRPWRNSVNTPIGALRYLAGANFQWRNWDFCGDQKAAAFTFTTGAENSSHGRSVKLRAHGIVIFLPNTGAVCRLAVGNGLLPSAVASRKAPTRLWEPITSDSVVTCSPIEIHGRTYYFPISITSVAHSKESNTWLRSVITASDYRKTDAHSIINYPFGSAREVGGSDKQLFAAHREK